MKHIIAVLLENEPGALSRVVALFSARGYNIESLTVAPTEDPSLSRMTIVTTGSDEVIEQITKHLNRLIEVVKVVDLTEAAAQPMLNEDGSVAVVFNGHDHDYERTQPINVRGQVIGFGGRVLDKGEPKYLNSPETPLFEKGRELYGLFEARTALRQSHCLECGDSVALMLSSG